MLSLCCIVTHSQTSCVPSSRGTDSETLGADYSLMFKIMSHLCVPTVTCCDLIGHRSKQTFKVTSYVDN